MGNVLQIITVNIAIVVMHLLESFVSLLKWYVNSFINNMIMHVLLIRLVIVLPLGHFLPSITALSIWISVQ